MLLVTVGVGLLLLTSKVMELEVIIEKLEIESLPSLLTEKDSCISLLLLMELEIMPSIFIQLM